MKQIPYITIETLEQVLSGAVGQNALTAEVKDRLMSDCVAAVQVQIRKSEKTKAVNILRQKCLALNNRVYDISRHRILSRKKRRKEERESAVRLENARLQAALDDLKAKHLAELNEIYGEIDSAEAEALKYEEGSDEYLATRERRQASTRKISARKAEYSIERKEAYDRFCKALEDYDFVARTADSNYESWLVKEREKQAVIAATIREATPEVLEAICNDLRGKLPEYEPGK